MIINDILLILAIDIKKKGDTKRVNYMHYITQYFFCFIADHDVLKYISIDRYVFQVTCSLRNDIILFFSGGGIPTVIPLK